MRLENVGSLLLDLDGCVWFGDDLAPGADHFVEAARESGLSLGFLTNISSGDNDGLARKLSSMGIPATADDVFMPMNALPDHPLMAGRPPALVLGRPDVALQVAGMTGVTSDPFAAELVVLSRDPTLTYRHMADAVTALVNGASLLALNLDNRVPVADGLVLPGNGAIAAALTAASGVEPHCVGKPSASYFFAAMRRFGMDPAATVMVGDNLDSDVRGGASAGLRTVHVGGDDFSANLPPPRPDVRVTSLLDLGPMLGLDVRTQRAALR